MYVGRISYGIYVLHLFVPWLYPRYLVHLGFPEFHVHVVFKALGYTVLTIVLATASWYGFEKPINALKKHFPYAPSGIAGTKPLPTVPDPVVDRAS